uniref:Uncharacterized protein n=1 Tax=Romanomermis culicivorax TaxID=13658 RepID=A0A915J0V4_ROMCU
MPKVSHMPPDHPRLPSQSSLPNTANAVRRALNFDQIMLPPTTNIAQSSAVPAVSLPPSNSPLSIFSNSALDGTEQAQVPLIPTAPPPANSLLPPPLSQNSVIAAAICASAPAVSQIPPPSNTTQANNDTTVARTNSSDSFINIDLLQAPATTCASLTAHCTQQLRVQGEIQEQVQSTNPCFAALAEQMQQLISTTTATAAAHNSPTPRPPPVTTWFQGPETRNIYIPNKTLYETEPALAFSRPPAHIKPKVPSTDTLYNNKFSRKTRGEDKTFRTPPQGRPRPAVNPFGFSDYLPDDYYGHLQPGCDLPCMSHREEDVESKLLSTICTHSPLTEP